MPENFQINIVNVATTISGTAAAGSVTPSPVLKSKTPIGVITKKGNSEELSLYRLSSAVPGQYSKEIYKRKGGKWKLEKKDPVKCPEPPYAPPGAFQVKRGELEIWSMGKMTEEDIEKVEELMKPSTRP